jgi:hypothetical protein
MYMKLNFEIQTKDPRKPTICVSQVSKNIWIQQNVTK